VASKANTPALIGDDAVRQDPQRVGLTVRVLSDLCKSFRAFLGRRCQIDDRAIDVKDIMEATKVLCVGLADYLDVVGADCVVNECA
jgi:hypothetical protein